MQSALSLTIGALVFGFWCGSRPSSEAEPRVPPVESPYAQWKVPPSAAARKNPFAGSGDHVMAGAKIFRRYCSSCHGREAQGTTEIIALATDRIRKAPEGSLFWYIKNGNLKGGMPGWSRLPDQQIWQIISYLQMRK